MLVAASFRPDSASGRLVAATRDRRLLALWTDATRTEAERMFGQIPPLDDHDLAPLFPEAGRVAAPLDMDAVAGADGVVDQTLAALALSTGAPLVTADRLLTDAAAAAGVTVFSPAEAARRLLG